MKKRICTFCCLIMAVSLYSQSTASNYEMGLRCREQRDYVKGLSIFSSLLSTDSSNLNYLLQSSFFYGRYGCFQGTKKEKRAYYTIAKRLAEKALRIDNQNSEAHYVYAMSLAYLAQVSDMKFRLSVGRTIKKEAELAVHFNPRNAAALHMLGRWHMIMAGFEGLQRAAVSCVLPDLIKDANFNDAIKYLTTAQLLEPQYKPHMVGLAETYYKMHLESMAEYWVRKAHSLETRTDEDRFADQKCKELAEKLRLVLSDQAAITLTKK